MTTMTRHAAGTFCWTQLGTPDPQGAKKFYSGLFGWTTEDTPVGNGPGITLLKKQGKEIGALYDISKVKEVESPNWMSFIAVDSTDQTAAAVRKLGGKVVMEPTDIVENGRTAVFEDPTTGAFGIWQAGKQPGAAVVNETNAMCWNELITTDSAKAGAFYRQVFGWTEERKSVPQIGTYTVFKKGDIQLAGMIQATPQMKLTHPYWLVYFAVDDCDKSVAKAEQLGGKTRMPPTDIPDVGRSAVLSDPHGAYFAVIKLTM